MPGHPWYCRGYGARRRRCGRRLVQRVDVNLGERRDIVVLVGRGDQLVELHEPVRGVEFERFQLLGDVELKQLLRGDEQLVLLIVLERADRGDDDRYAGHSPHGL